MAATRSSRWLSRRRSARSRPISRPASRVFEDLVRTNLLDNQHRTTVLLKADPELGAEGSWPTSRRGSTRCAPRSTTPASRPSRSRPRSSRRCRRRSIRPRRSPRSRRCRCRTCRPHGKPIPIERETLEGVPLYTHPLPTNGVLYLDLGFDLMGLPKRLVPLVPLFARALTQTGTSKEDFVSLSQRIGRSTGGVGASRWGATRRDGKGTVARLFIRGKSTLEKSGELLAIMNDIITDARLDNRERIRQMALEGKAGFESSLAGMGNGIATSRLRAQFSESDWLGEQVGGVTQYFFLKDLSRASRRTGPASRPTSRPSATSVLNRAGVIANLTAEAEMIAAFRPQLGAFLTGLAAVGRHRRHARLHAGAPQRRPHLPGQGQLRGQGRQPHRARRQAVGRPSRSPSSTSTRPTCGTRSACRAAPMAAARASTRSRVSSRSRPTAIPTCSRRSTNYDGAAAFLRQPTGEQDLDPLDHRRHRHHRHLPPAGRQGVHLAALGADGRHRRGPPGTARAGARREPEGLRRAGRWARCAGKDSEVVVLGSETAINAANAERGAFLKVTKVL